MIKERERLLQHLMSEEKDSFADAAVQMLIEANVLVNSVQSHIGFGRGQSIKAWFRDNTNLNDWASVFKSYNVFATFEPNKEWTDTRIKTVRKCYDLTSLDYTKLKL